MPTKNVTGRPPEAPNAWSRSISRFMRCSRTRKNSTEGGDTSFVLLARRPVNFHQGPQIDPGLRHGYWGGRDGFVVSLCSTPGIPSCKAGPPLKRPIAVGPEDRPRASHISAIGTFLPKDFEKSDHKTRALAYEKGDRTRLSAASRRWRGSGLLRPACKPTADPNDKTYRNQLKSRRDSREALCEQPNHPGIAQLFDSRL